ncbi:MAG TPA: hypothetical protein PKD70_06215 [Saprospiraceae bacterium]|nr:hypothetical protein [Saprospiraceae bacterium]HMP13452.1 hypothetical protein [Saprospiraceae bacterium]
MNQDIIVDPNDDNDLVIQGGDFFIAFSDFQHIAHIIEAEPGNYKQHPLLGFGVRNYINGVFDGPVKRRLQLQLEADGHRTRRITYADGVLDVKI